MKHDLYEPERFEGCAACRVCKGFEGTLTTDCPGVVMTATQDQQVYRGEIDFRDGAWVNKASGKVSSHHKKSESNL